MTLCAICDLEFSGNERGRPAVYCSTACRRAAEFEIRRVERRLGELEQTLITIRTSEVNVLASAPLIEAELVRQRARLLQLLAEPDRADVGEA